jgi:hypothetical protein
MHARIHNNQVVEYPIINLRQRLPDVSLPADLSNDESLPLSFVYVRPVPPPECNPATHKLVQYPPRQVNGHWESGYDAVPLSAEERIEVEANKSAEARLMRDQKLAECDWTQLPDAPVDKVAWAVYRQALRDVTKQPGFPISINWPEAP